MPTKPKLGRPKGSKNKPKPVNAKPMAEIYAIVKAEVDMRVERGIREAVKALITINYNLSKEGLKVKPSA